MINERGKRLRLQTFASRPYDCLGRENKEWKITNS